MGTRRKHLGVAVYNNMIYAVGGRDDTTELSSAERYNPQTNTWQPVVAMTSRRSGVSILMHVFFLYFILTFLFLNPIMTNFILYPRISFLLISSSVMMTKFAANVHVKDKKKIYHY